MRKSAKLGLLALVTAIMAALAASPASAITVEGGEEITASSERLVLLSEGGIVNPAITCEVTLTGSIEAEIEEGEVVGDTDNVVVNSCTGGTARPISPFGWDIFLNEIVLSEANSGSGNLTQRGVSFEVTVAGVNCRFGGSTNFVLPASGSPLVATTLDTTRELTLVDTGGSILCPPRGGLQGTFELDPSLTLIL
jgi:hypothetical protein